MCVCVSSSLATEMVKGKTIDDALSIRNTDIASHLNLPPVKLHCSMLAEDAVKVRIFLSLSLCFYLESLMIFSFPGRHQKLQRKERNCCHSRCRCRRCSLKSRLFYSVRTESKTGSFSESGTMLPRPSLDSFNCQSAFHAFSASPKQQQHEGHHNQHGNERQNRAALSLCVGSNGAERTQRLAV